MARSSVTPFFLALLLAATPLLPAAAPAAPTLVLLDTASLSWTEQQVLRGSKGLSAWVEVGDHLLAEVDPEAGFSVPGQQVLGEELRLTDVHVALSRHHDPLALVARHGRVLHRAGPFVLFTADPASLNRIRSQGLQHEIEVAALEPGTVLLRSPTNVALTSPPAFQQPRVRAIADAIDPEEFEANLTKLVAFETRYTYSPRIQEAIRWARDKLGDYGLTTEVVHFNLRSRMITNVVATLPGRSRADEVYVVGAHLDSIAYDSMTYAPGADDNGSGSAGLLELARVFAQHPPEATLRFILFTGEEQGLYGSKQYVRTLKRTGRIGQVKAMINLDMISYDKSPPIQTMLEGRVLSHPVSDVLQAAAATYVPDLQVHRTDYAWGSDHVPFLDARVPSVLTFEYEYDDNPNDHTPRDTIEHVNVDLATAILRMDAAALAVLAGE